MILADKAVHHTATMARFRITDANAEGFAGMRRVLDGDITFLWLHGRRKSGKGYALSALRRSRMADYPSAHLRHVHLDAAHLLFVMTGVKRWGGSGLDGLIEGLTRAATLLIDDIEHLLGNDEHEALLFRLFTGRLSAGRPTVVTSNLHPGCLALRPPLASILRIPDVATASLAPLRLRERRAIVEREVAAQRSSLPAGVTALIARNEQTTETQLRSITRRYLLSARRVVTSAPALPFDRVLTR